MKVDDFIDDEGFYEELEILNHMCMQFIHQSRGYPLLKNLSNTYGDFHKIKVRFKKRQDNFTETFNHAFENEIPSLRQRAIFANGPISFEPEEGELEPFFIFPIDGYSFLYCSEIENSSSNHKQTFDVLLEHFGPKKGEEIIQDVLRFSYTSKNLYEGIESGAEIIIYNIPFYYAVKASIVEDYDQLLTSILEQ